METEYIKTVDALNGIYNCPTKTDADGYIWVRTIDVAHMIDDIPTADVRPVVYGGWKPNPINPYWLDCTVCGYAKPERTVYNFCPNCGADMMRYYHKIIPGCIDNYKHRMEK